MLKKLMVTGGCGFIGSAVCRYGVRRGVNILNVDSMSYAANEANLNAVKGNSNYAFEKLDIRNLAALKKVFEDFQPDAVMHLAAESHVDRSIGSPESFISTNIVGTFNLLEAARGYVAKKGTKARNFIFHHVSTDEVFGSLDLDSVDLFTEKSRYIPSSPYSASKASSDHLVRSWHETYGLRTVITNCSNNYGPYQLPEKLIPLMILNCLAWRPLPIYGDGGNVRDWLYVDDHVEALFLALEKGSSGQTYNVGGNNESSNLELVQHICDILDKLSPKPEGSYRQLIRFVEDRPGHDLRYAIDASLIRQELGWKPRTSLATGLEETIRWYLNNSEWWQQLSQDLDLKDRLAGANHAPD